MALNLTEAAQRESEKINAQPQVVLQIEGIATTFGAVEILKYVRIGDEDLVIGGGWKIGGLNPVIDQADYISLDGSSTTINQQLHPDKGSVSSISSVTIALIDKDNLLTEIISPGVHVEDILARRCRLWLGYKNSAWPDDFVEVFVGMVDQVDSFPGKIHLSLSHPDMKKRQELFHKKESTLTADVEYKSKKIQNLVYFARPGKSTEVNIAYTGGATAGAEGVTVVGNAISVQIESGVSSANQIKSALEESRAAMNLVYVESEGDGTAVQTTVGATNLEISTTVSYNAADPNADFLGSASFDDPVFKTYFRIEDEIVGYTGAPTSPVTVTRGELTSVSVRHPAGTKFESFYVLEGDMIDLALKLMLSGHEGVTYQDDVPVKHINYLDLDSPQPGALFFERVNLNLEYGTTVGDRVYISGAIEPSNNHAAPADGKVIESMTVTDSGTWITLTDKTFIDEFDSTALVSFVSKYSTLQVGLGMTPREVDVEEHEFWRDLILVSYEYRFFIRDKINGKEFIEKEIYAPYGAYSVPRKGRASMGMHIGPIPRGEIPVLNEDVIREADKIKLSRSVNKNFYNIVAYSFDEDPIEEKFLTGQLYLQADSQSRIKVGNKVLRFESKGIRTDLLGQSNSDRAANRFFGRYKFGAEYIEKLKVFFSTGLQVEPGDLVLLDFENLHVSNTKEGSREKPSKFFEVTNRSLNFKTGEVTLDLVDTAYDSSERYGTISPSSVIESVGSDYVVITDSYGEKYPNNEPRKWSRYQDMDVLIHDENFTTQITATFIGFDSANRYKMKFSAPLSSAPSPGWIVDIPPYPSSSDPDENREYKLFHAHLSPRVTITAGVSGTRFTVGAGDISKFQVGVPVRVHSEDFTVDSAEVLVDSISGNDVILSDDLGFTPSAGQYADFVGFKDGEHPYRYL